MLTLGLIIIGLGIAGVAVWGYRRYRQHRRRRTLTQEWGRPREHLQNWNLIPLYHESINTEALRLVDPQTWDELDMNTLFTRMDRTYSRVGQQYLYAMLHQLLADRTLLERRREAIRFFQDQAAPRIECQLLLQQLATDKDMFLPWLFTGSLPTIASSRWWLLVSPVLLVVSVLLAFFVWGGLWFGVGGFVVLNMVLYARLRKRYGDYIQAMFSLSMLCTLGEQLEETLAEDASALDSYQEQLAQVNERLTDLRKLMRYLPPVTRNPESLSGMLYEYLNQWFLVEPNLYFGLVQRLRADSTPVQRLFALVGEIDALQSVASYHTTLGMTCVPEWQDNPQVMRFRSVWHPLLADPVTNDITLTQKSALITGSNMSGKSTFLKTVGVNTILAQSVAFCCAESAVLYPLHVVSSMQQQEDLVGGKSYYFAEVERIKSLLHLVESAGPQLVLLDEVFRGTNTIERIAASCEVLRYLQSPQSVVFAATHDIELADLLADQYVFFHFREAIEAGTLHFDYTLYPGVSSTRNAIAILDLMEYPATVVQNARELAESLESLNTAKRNST